MDITFAEAAKGGEKKLSMNISDTCPRCGGKGNEPGCKVSVCHYCNGTGTVSPAVPVQQKPSIVTTGKTSVPR